MFKIKKIIIDAQYISIKCFDKNKNKNKIKNFRFKYTDFKDLFSKDFWEGIEEKLKNPDYLKSEVD